MLYTYHKKKLQIIWTALLILLAPLPLTGSSGDHGNGLKPSDRPLKARWGTCGPTWPSATLRAAWSPGAWGPGCGGCSAWPRPATETPAWTPSPVSGWRASTPSTARHKHRWDWTAHHLLRIEHDPPCWIHRSLKLTYSAIHVWYARLYES